MWLVSVLCLLFVAGLCALGVFAKAYDDNLAQRVGMTIVCIGSMGRAGSVLVAQSVPADAMVLHVGVAVFAAGVAWRFVPRPLRWPSLEKQ